MISLLLSTTILIWLIMRQYQKCQRLPPGPISIPLIGNIPQICYYLWRYGGLNPMWNVLRKKYGNIYTLWIGPIPHVVITDYETSHEVFVKHGSKYTDKFLIPSFAYMANGQGVVSTNGEFWQEIRRFSLTVFRNMGVGRDLMEEKIMAELDARCAQINGKSTNGKVNQDVNEFFDLTVGSIINSILVGKRIDEETVHEYSKQKELMDKMMNTVTALDVTFPVWFLKMFFGKKFDTLINIHSETKNYVARDALKRYEDVKSGKYTIDPDNLNDYVDAFLYKMEQEDKNGGNEVFTIKSMKNILMDLWLTGQETTSSTLVTGFILLLHNREIMSKVRDELMVITGNGGRSLSLKDKNMTPLLNATIGEIQRHASILNLNFWKVNHELTYINGQPVDANTLITSQLSAIHTNDHIFDNPHLFDPMRFIRNDQLLQQIIPFGVGKRSCLGESLARAELYLILGNLLLRYDFQPIGQLPSTKEIEPYGFSKRPQKFSMQFVKL